MATRDGADEKARKQTKRTVAVFGSATLLCIVARYMVPEPAKPYLLVSIVVQAFVAVMAWLKTTRMANEIKEAFRNFDGEAANALMCPRWEPWQLIQWLTGGRFDLNVSCQEKLSHNGYACERDACRFDVWRQSLNMPPVLRESIGWLKRFRVGKVELRKHIEFQPQDGNDIAISGKFIGLSVYGIALLVDRGQWKRFWSGRTGAIANHRMTAHIQLRLRTARVTILPKEAEKDHKLNQSDEVVVYGNYEQDGFNPAKITPSKTGHISAPICSLYPAKKDREAKQYTKREPIALDENQPQEAPTPPQ